MQRRIQINDITAIRQQYKSFTDWKKRKMSFHEKNFVKMLEFNDNRYTRWFHVNLAKHTEKVNVCNFHTVCDINYPIYVLEPRR